MDETLAELREIKKALQAIASSLERERIFDDNLKASIRYILKFFITLGIGALFICLWDFLF